MMLPAGSTSECDAVEVSYQQGCGTQRVAFGARVAATPFTETLFGMYERPRSCTAWPRVEGIPGNSPVTGAMFKVSTWGTDLQSSVAVVAAGVLVPPSSSSTVYSNAPTSVDPHSDGQTFSVRAQEIASDKAQTLNHIGHGNIYTWHDNVPSK